MYFHLLIMKFFWFAYLWFRINVKTHNKAFADVDWGGVGGGGGLDVVLHRMEVVEGIK